MKDTKLEKNNKLEKDNKLESQLGFYLAGLIEGDGNI
jgi:hypothetical protein